MRVLVTITVYNEAKNIGSVLKMIPSEYDVLVVDDGSSDSTPDIARSAGAFVVRHPINLGQGPAVITSFKIAVMEGYDIIIEMDGDGQHDPAEIPAFIDKLVTEDVDIVVGSRILGRNYKKAPFMRIKFLPYFTFVINKITGYNLTDSMCGFRAFKAQALTRVIHQLEDMFEPQYIAAEMFIRFADAGLIVTEIPIKLHPRSSGKSYKGMFLYGFGVSKAILKTYFDKKRKNTK